MAVIKKNTPSLTALTATALALPGLLTHSAVAAEGDEVDFQYSHYQEGKRELYGAKSNFNPIEVDSLNGRSVFKLTDRIKFAFNYVQDTWGGATPVATAPLVFGGNGQYNGSKESIISSGATPFVQLHTLLFDKNLNPMQRNVDGVTYQKNNQLVHTLSVASPETRKQGDFKLGYEWDQAALNIGGGISTEDDYESRFGNMGARFDFNQKRTTLNIGLSYTNSDTNATIDHDLRPYISGLSDLPQYSVSKIGAGIIQGNRQDWSTTLGLTQILTKDTLIEAGLGYTRSTGYMSNPYKVVEVAFIDPQGQDPNLSCPESLQGLLCADMFSFVENRPEERNQWTGNLKLIQHIDSLDSALHFGYRVFSDDWGVTAHTFDADWVQPLSHGWTITPRIRYYSQDEANFYTPYLTTPQGFTSNVIDPVKGQVYQSASNGQSYYNDNTGTVPIPVDSSGNPVFNLITGNAVLDAQGNVVSDPNIVSSLIPATKPFNRSLLPAHYSSDQRLSGYGALSGGVTVSKQFSKGVTVDLGFEYYTHKGSLKIGGGGEGAYADFDYWLANAALKINLEALAFAGGGLSHNHSHAEHHAHGVYAPAGVMFDHLLPNAGDFMVGYRFMWNSQGGNLLNGTENVNDNNIINNGCQGPNSAGCFLTPSTMSMSMHMVDLMYAPTDWLTLMLMPQFVDMSMGMRALDGINAATEGNNIHFDHHQQNPHETGGIGDLGIYALFKLYDKGTHHVHATAGLSAPTGDVDLQFRRSHTVDGGYYDYGMQLGSGTWDFKPSVTYTGHVNQFSWGAQANATVRMEDHNKSGYRLGDMFQGTVWGGYNLTNWLTASVRGVYTWQGRIEGQFNGSAGGQFVDRTISKTRIETQQQFDEFGNPLFDQNGNPLTVDVPVTDVTSVNSSILKFGPNDYPQNYGGRFWDVGFGLSATVPYGDLSGNRLSVEWLQPVHTDVNGYQLDRDGALSATWSLMF